MKGKSAETRDKDEGGCTSRQTAFTKLERRPQLHGKRPTKKILVSLWDQKLLGSWVSRKSPKENRDKLYERKKSFSSSEAFKKEMKHSFLLILCCITFRLVISKSEKKSEKKLGKRDHTTQILPWNSLFSLCSCDFNCHLRYFCSLFSAKKWDIIREVLSTAEMSYWRECPFAEPTNKVNDTFM